MGHFTYNQAHLRHAPEAACEHRRASGAPGLALLLAPPEICPSALPKRERDQRGVAP
jgi:hypothetical protein